MSDHYAPARGLIERGVPVALGTDFNPGTSPTANAQLVLSIACLQLKLTPSEALAAMTINAAAALGMADSRGTLEEGREADLVIWDVPSHRLLPYWLGAGNLVRTVVKRGHVVWSATPTRFYRAARAGRRSFPPAAKRSRRSASSPLRAAGRSSRAGTSPSPSPHPLSRAPWARSAWRPSWVTSSAARAAAETAANGHARDFDRAQPVDHLLAQQVADLAQVDRMQAVELVDEAMLRPRSAPFCSSRNVRTPVTRISWTSYSPGESSRNALARLVGTLMPSPRSVRFAPVRRPSRSAGLVLGVAVGGNVGGQPAAGGPDKRASSHRRRRRPHDP